MDIIKSEAELAQENMREKVLRLEDELKKYEQAELEVRHHFAEGMYARELFIPKGTVLTGKIHRHGHLNVISKGDISVLTEHGMKRITAPAVIVSSPGIKRAGFAHEDTIWMTFHATHETDLEKIEKQVIAESFDELKQIEVKEDILCLG